MEGSKEIFYTEKPPEFFTQYAESTITTAERDFLREVKKHCGQQLLVELYVNAKTVRLLCESALDEDGQLTPADKDQYIRKILAVARNQASLIWGVNNRLKLNR